MINGWTETRSPGRTLVTPLADGGDHAAEFVPDNLPAVSSRKFFPDEPLRVQLQGWFFSAGSANMAHRNRDAHSTGLV